MVDRGENGRRQLVFLVFNDAAGFTNVQNSLARRRVYPGTVADLFVSKAV